MLREINSLQRRVNANSTQFGRDSADFLYDAGRGFLAGLKSQEKEIKALMAEIAKSVSTTVKRELKIKSPSRVLRADGRDSGRPMDGTRWPARSWTTCLPAGRVLRSPCGAISGRPAGRDQA
ncbi:hypothetical protein ACIBKY_49775 [Nonomuraea sp. NPDC050394]|uniref:hypothetical protein n=1 Tax=Nonomuraea sp. NPDC050394 TaxID=3364363 RepID=UPI0037A9886B